MSAANHTPYIPPPTTYTDKHGVVARVRRVHGASSARPGIVFFAFIGFDAVSTAAQEAKNPKRDMPIGILGSLAICTVLYILFAHVLTRHRPGRVLPQRRAARPRSRAPSTRSCPATAGCRTP